MNRNRIFVVGDSHSTFWNGQDSFRSQAIAFTGVDLFYMGPLLAQNLHKPGDDFANQRTIEAIAHRAGSPGAIVSCFGEIDCRVHIVQAAVQSGRSLEETSRDVAAGYFAFMSDLAARCECPIVAWAPPPTQLPDTGINVKFPKTGSMAERNFATFQFISQLERLAAPRPDMAVCSLFENLIDPAGNTRPGIFYDGWHLSSAHLRAAVRLVIAALNKFGVPHLGRCFERKWPIGSELRIQNVAVGLLPGASSNRAKPARIPAALTGESREIVVTNLEPDPWISIVLDSAYLVEAVEYTFGEATPAISDVSVAGNLRTDIAVHPAHVEELPNSTIRFRFEPPQLVTTLKLQARGTQSLRLKSARVLAGTYAT